ncbi:hypothetical protein RHOSPDRAFT_36011 [Rhodotorula sp. JG-1b]|nr:hypothetical protein RHOSPDRAFT_36011 [Rhodotorula sp. JG-1b]
MSSRTSPALLPDPKRPRLLAPGDEASSPPAVPSVAPDVFARANYTGRNPPPTQVATTYERASYPATQTVTGSSPESSSASSAAPTARTPYPSSSAASSVHARPRRSGLPFTAAEEDEIAVRLQKGLADIVIAAILERTPQEIQSEIRVLVWQLKSDLANGPQTRPPYTPEDYTRLLQMHRRGESVERIALVLRRTTSSIINHFRKHKPTWTVAGERVEPALLLRDSEIDYEERIQRELAGPAGDMAARITKIRLAAATRPAATAPSTPSGSPSTSGSSLQAGTAMSAESSGTITAKLSLPPFTFGNDAPAPPRLSAIAPTPTPAAPAAPPKVNHFKLRPSTSPSVVDSPMNLPAAAREVATSAAAPAPSSTGFSAYSTAASLVPTASIPSVSPAPSLVTKPVPTRVPLPTGVAPPPPPSKPFFQAVKPAAHPAPLPLPAPTPAPTTTTSADTLDPDASPLSPTSDDSPPSLSQRLPNPVPHHASHLPLLPLWSDGHYEQGMSGLKRFLQLVEGSRKSRTRSTSSS